MPWCKCYNFIKPLFPEVHFFKELNECEDLDIWSQVSLTENPKDLPISLPWLINTVFPSDIHHPHNIFSSSYCKQKTHPPNICSISEARPVCSDLNLYRCMTRWVDWLCRSYCFVSKKKNNVMWIFTVLNSILLSVSWKTCHMAPKSYAFSRNHGTLCTSALV